MTEYAKKITDSDGTRWVRWHYTHKGCLGILEQVKETRKFLYFKCSLCGEKIRERKLETNP